MSNEQSSPILLDAVKAQASKFKETKNALEARAKELDATKAQLEAERTELDRQFAKLKNDREEFARERDEVHNARSSIDRDLNAIRSEHERLGTEEKRLQDWARTVNEREKAIKDGEDRVKRLEHEFNGQIKESEAKLMSIVEREEGIAQRERSLAETIGRLANMERGVSGRGGSPAKREEDLIRLQNEGLGAPGAPREELAK